MKYYIDLHIHSSLSPCAENDMTPNNIVKMAVIKGLDIIAVTDHNSVENAEAVLKCAEKAGILAVPGMELETREEVHVVCLFPDIEKAMKMQDVVYKAMPPLENREDIFGEQIIVDENDNIRKKLKRMLLIAADIGLEEAFHIIEKLNGAMIPAHIDRDSYSIISNLGMVPNEISINCLEVSRVCDLDKYLETNPQLKKFRVIKSSDAHNLGDILERETFIELDKKDIICLINRLKYNK
ncbi:MAG: PHP domain-containing protein [Firmicutes bacterium]|nr:PHP domain-containing protein [Bacillota bacterium]